MVTVPAPLAAAVAQSPEGAAWLKTLPALITTAVARWRLTIGEPVVDDATCSWVAPGVMENGTRIYLKIGFPHMEARDEIVGLAHWDGRGMVRLLASDTIDNAMLLEACAPGTSLRSRPYDEQDTIVAAVLRTLWRAGPNAQFRPLSDMTTYWCDCAFGRMPEWREPDLIRDGLAELSTLSNDPISPVVLHTDLHAGNILSAQRDPWLAIDPKPFVGDPAYDATQHLLNCRDRLAALPTATISSFSEMLEVDPVRVQRWLFARLAQEASLDPSAGNLARRVARF